ncbi:MAG TPA: PAS domain-containing protein [Polaromonas sp.]|uniref:PAS domain-containing protein n=1 Tax=Polaromonas sp. TaxID=1869339 RepID=UPI002D55BB76|nr:PAS domain-containing protein [Polaromonas sp.]HYW55973.1 PAS domain-containing protein [Polaromonas sp.]
MALGPGATLGPRENTFRGRRYSQSRTVMADAEGKIIGVLIASIDMHEKHLAEQALAVERDRLQLLVRATKAGFGDWDAQKDVVTYSRRFKEMLGYPGEEDTSRWPSLFDMMHPDDREASREQFRKMISRKKNPGTEQEPGAPMAYRLRRADGSYIWIHAEGISQVDDEGRTQRFITSFLDVTAFHEQEEALRAQVELTRTEQRRLDLVVRGARVGIVDWDGKTHETYYSPRFREIRGYPPDTDTTDWPDYFKVMIHPDDQERITRRWVAFIKGKGPEGPRGEFYSPDEYRVMRADGSSAWVQVSGIAVRDEAGFAVRWIAAIIDLSERRAQEEALLASHAQLADRMKFVNDLVDALPLALSMRDPAGRYVFANRTWERYYGQRREDAIGHGAAEAFELNEAQRVEALDAAALKQGTDGPLYTEDVHFEGREYTEMRTVMLNARDEAVGVVVATQDVTERRRIERALATEQKRIELVVRAAKAGIVDFDAIARTGYYSPRLREILGHAPDADTSAWPDYFDMIHPDDKGRVASEFRKHIVAKREPGAMAYHDRIDYRLKRADASWVWVQGMGVSITNEKGLTAQFIASITDISERREQDEMLRAQAMLLEEQNEALKENVRLREEVERIARHDIKTPLNSIIAVPRLLREERQLTREADELLGIVERAGYRILSMVNLSLDLYKMEQGGYIFRPDAVDLVDLFDKVAVDIHSHAASKNVSLRIKSSATRACAWAEELLCYSLIANLLKNAVEASPEGAVVTASIEAIEESGKVALHIHNVGMVPEAVRGAFFVKYATAGKASGTGLGTYSARLMARVQDGDVTMQTSASEGTTLSVTLRAAPVGKVPAILRHASERRDHPQPLGMGSLPASTVLLVDDDEFNLLIVRRFLPTPPLKVFTAFNGRVALEVALEEKPDVVFMDLDMPIMGGLEAIGKLRQQEVANGMPRCFAVVLSSHDDDETRTRCLASGFDHYLTKPVTRDLIQKTLRDHGRKANVEAAPREDASSETAPATVEVDPDLASLMTDFLLSRRQLLDSMDQAAMAGDREELRRAAHQLAGSLAVYGFQWAAGVGKTIERGASSLTPDKAQELIQSVRVHLETVKLVVPGDET